MKCVLYEEGVFWKIKDILAKENPDDNLACAAVLQNISEHRFLKGIFSSSLISPTSRSPPIDTLPPLLLAFLARPSTQSCPSPTPLPPFPPRPSAPPRSPSL